MNSLRLLPRRLIRLSTRRSLPPLLKSRPALEALEDRYLPSSFTYFDLRPQDRGVQDIERGPDGNMWFTEFDNDAVGRITLDGSSLSDFYLPRGSVPNYLTTGADGNVWITEYNTNKIAKMSPTGILLNEYPLPQGDSQPNVITAGPDGNVWFTEDGFGDGGGKKVGRVSPSGDIATCSIPSFGRGVTAGSDGNVWFNMALDAEVGRVNLVSQNVCDITYFPIDTEGYSGGMTTGPDGNIWSTTNIDKSVLRINVKTGAVMENVQMNSAPEDIIDVKNGPDGNLYVGSYAPGTGSRFFYSITPTYDGTDSVVNQIPLDEGRTNYFQVAPGTDGNIWLYDLAANQIGRYNLGSNVDSSGGPKAGAFATTMTELAGTTNGASALAGQVPVGQTPLSQTGSWQTVDGVFNTAASDRGMAPASQTRATESTLESPFLHVDLGGVPVLADPLVA
jgi:streptogramin lyase